MLKTLVIILSFILFGFSCSKGGGGGNQPVDCNTVPKTFTNDVSPIVQSFCNQPNCHASGSVNGPGPLTNYTQVFNARNQIRPAIQSGLMPQNAALTSAQKNAIICWIDSGAPNN